MRLAEHAVSIAARFEGLKPRERALVCIAALAAIIAAFDMAVMSPLAAKRRALGAELAAIQAEMGAASLAAEQASASDPLAEALAQERSLGARLDAVDAQLASQSAGLIPPRRMARVIEDVLSRHPGVTLVSLRNLPSLDMASLDIASGKPSTGERAATGGGSDSAGGPYVHAMELVLDGSYLDVLAYLRALEQLPWRFYWRRLELDTTAYPNNRVRVELGTVSLSEEWVGL